MIRKKFVCSQCGTVHKGFYVCPIRNCGNPLRELSIEEKKVADAIWHLSSEEPEKQKIFNQREWFISREWNSSDVWQWFLGQTYAWISYIVVWIVGSQLKISDILWAFVTLLLGSIILVLDMIRVIVKTIYFQCLKKSLNESF